MHAVLTKNHANKYILEMEKAICPTTVVKVGGAGRKCLELVEGTANTMFYFKKTPTGPGLSRWDTLSSEVFVNCLGG